MSIQGYDNSNAFTEVTVLRADEIKIDEKFLRMFPKLDERTSADLEKNILLNGCLVPLVLWDGILIDGHNRYEILKKHDMPVKTVSMEFASRDLVEIWIIENQILRRNLTPMQLSFYRGSHYHLEKKVQGSNNQFVQKSENVHNEHFQGSTARRLAETYNVSPMTIRRDAQVANAISAIGEVSPDIKMDILSGKTRVSRVQLKELAAGTKEDVSAVISQIEEGTFKSRRSGLQLPGDDVGGSANVSDETDMQPWELQFVKMTDEFRQSLRGHAKIADTGAVKATIRQYIDMLEELYQGI